MHFEDFFFSRFRKKYIQVLQLWKLVSIFGEVENQKGIRETSFGLVVRGSRGGQEVNVNNY